MKFVVSFFIALLGFVSLSSAQRLFQSKDAFPNDVRKMIERGSAPRTVEVADGISALWTSGFSEAQKDQLYDIGRKMYKRNYPTNPTFEDFFACVFLAKKENKLSEDLFAQFLSVADTTINEASVGVATNFFKITRVYLAHQQLYKYKNYGLIVEENPQISFGYGREAAVAENAIDLPSDIEETISQESGEGNTEETPSAEDLWGEDTGTDNGWGDNTGWDDWATEDNTENDTQSTDDGWGSADEWGGGWSDAGDAWGATDETEEKKETPSYDPIKKPDPVDTFIQPEAEGLALAGPYMSLENTTLTIQTPNDTVQVKNTSGHVVFAKAAFTGEGGRFDWGVLPDVYGEFDKFHFEVSKPEIKAEEFKLYYSSYADSAILGRFNYFAARSNNKPNPLYPRFISYKNNVEVKGLVKDIIYEGGFSLVGKKILSNSLNGGSSAIRLDQGDSTRFRAVSFKGFVFNPTSVTNPLAQLIIYTSGKDSIMHRGVRLRYDAEKESLLARRDKKGFKYSPFVDSYHEVSISADYVNWDLTADTMNIYSLAGRGAVIAAYEAASRNESKRDSILKQIDFVTVTSNAYFNEYELRALQSMYRFNPLVMAWAYISKRKPFSLSFGSAEVAQKFNQNPTQVKNSMRGLENGGFVEFDEAADWVTLTPKGLLYARANLPVRSRLYSDYDRIRLSSLGTNSDNLTYYFENNELVVRGVEEVTFSNAKIDSVNTYAVKAKPVDKQVIIKKNRDMTVNGQVAAKNFIFNGAGFEFNYKDFKFDMEKIDSMQFFVEGDTMPNSFKDVSGTFSINLPYNKAGVYDTKRFADSQRYPLFNTTSGGTVRFGGDEVMGGAYNDSTIRFDVDNFTLDSLAQRKPEDLRFGGTFNTPIFEKFKEPIRVMPDKSLGFTHSVNDEQHPDGMPLYGGRAMLNTGTVIVSNSGIRAGSERYIEDIEKQAEERAKKGKPKKEEVLVENEPADMTYLAADLKSNDFIFYADSVTSNSSFAAEQISNQGKINSMTIDEAAFPDVEMNNYKMKWLPQYDSMMLTTTTETFGMYNNVSLQGGEQGADYTGTLALTPTGLKGYGKFETKDANIESELFSFETKRLFGRESTFRIQALDETQPPAVEATNVRFEYNIDASPRTAQITSENIGEQVFDFPSLKYKTSLASAVWVADEKTVAFRVDKSEDVTQQYFVSSAPEQDSLNFRAEFANYNIPSGNLQIGGVPFILVLDTEIYPREGNVVIRQDAKMDKLEDAELVINSIQRYHKLTEGNIDILSRTEYQGEAVLNYENGTDKIEYLTLNNFSKQTITEDDIPDSLRKTAVAEELIGTEGTVSVTDIMEEADDDQVDEEDFIYSEGKQFKGAVTLKGWLSDLQFNGETRLVIGNSAQTGWFPLVSDGTGEKGKKSKVASTTGANILIQDQKIAGQPAFSGLYLNEEGISAPMMQEDIGDATPLLLAEGIVKVKAEEKYILVLSEERSASGEIEDGNSFKISKDNGTLEFDGNLDLFAENQRANVEVGAYGKANFRNQQYTIDAMVGINIDTKGDAFTFMADDLNAFVEENRDRLSLEPTVDKSKRTLLKMAALAGSKAAQNFQKRFEPNDYGVVDAVDDQTIVLSDVTMNWSPDQQTFYSVGEIGLASVKDQEIDVKTTGYFELPQSGDRESFTLYLELDPDKWYYFRFDGRTLYTLSSNEDYNAIITAPKAKDKFELAGRADVDEFMARFRGMYPTAPVIPLK